MRLTGESFINKTIRNVADGNISNIIDKVIKMAWDKNA